MIHDIIATLASEHATIATPVTGTNFRHISKRFLERFFPNVKQATGNWVYNDFRWHAYTFNHETALTGDGALNRYFEQSVQPFYIYHESDDLLFDCTASAWPDVRAIDNDVYVFPHALAWLFTTTHESSNGLGPFFAQPDP